MLISSHLYYSSTFKQYSTTPLSYLNFNPLDLKTSITPSFSTPSPQNSPLPSSLALPPQSSPPPPSLTKATSKFTTTIFSKSITTTFESSPTTSICPTSKRSSPRPPSIHHLHPSSSNAPLPPRLTPVLARHTSLFNESRE
ncbi:unnamed protein product [Dovyalis caffra]|uniref:Uncharacterized protein n=1 Tax=Dovyalis caffra TaxID=77055 RepID=A0AAV1RG62_9ROSI|nr:unnamed protein product [Dovyalis caffra]